MQSRERLVPGYLCDFDVYKGSQGVTEEGLTSRVVKELLRPPPELQLPVPNFGKGYHLFFGQLLLVWLVCP